MNRLSKFFDCFSFDHSNILNGAVLIKLDSAMEWPYYVSKSKVVFFNETDAAWYRLNGENLQEYAKLL
jgi:hypothetical protein